MVLARKIILFMYGPGYINTVPILELIIWALPAIFLSYILGTSIASINKQHETLKATFLCLILSTVGNYILIGLFSGIGAAMITILNEVSMVVFYIYIMHHAGYKVPVKDVVIKPLLASIVMGIVVYFLDLDLFVSVFVGIIVYVVMIFILRAFNTDDYNILKQLLPESMINKIEKIRKPKIKKGE